MKRTLKILTLIIVFLCINISFSFAAAGNADVKVTFTSNKSSFEKGEKFNITFKQECTDGIICIEGKLNYDDQIFKLISVDIGTNWSTNLGEGDSVSILANTDQKSGTVFTATFEALKGTKSSTISLREIIAYKTYTDFVNLESQNCELVVTDSDEPSTNEPDPDQPPTNKPNPDQPPTNGQNPEKPPKNESSADPEAPKNESKEDPSTNKPTNNSTNSHSDKTSNSAENKQSGTQGTQNNSNIDNSTTKTSLPKTGAKRVIIMIVILAAIAVVLYNQYEKYRGL